MIFRQICSALCRVRVGWRTLVPCLFLVACGGGVDSGGTGGNATSFVSGPITGFGSVIVNGVRFDDSVASVSDAEGTGRSRDDLKLGMTVELRGSGITTDSSGASTGTAASIVYGSAILGPIVMIDLTGASLIVLGQTVNVLTTTVFDASLGGALSALANGDVVEVYALFDAATNRYNATRIERKASATSFQLRGVVAALDAVARSFTIGTERISYATLAASEVPAGLANGSFVRVDVQTTLVGSVRRALRFRNGASQPQDRDEVRIEGLISAFTSSASFSVDGRAIDASKASFPDGTAGLAVGVRVALEGTVSSGSVSATQVEIRSQAEVETNGFELRGSITSIDRAARTFVLRGVTVDYSGPLGPVEYKDGNEATLDSAVNVRVRGRLSSDGTRLVATRIEFKS